MGRRSLRASEDGIQAIKKALKRNKWSQTLLAGRLTCSRQTIWSLLHGNSVDCELFMQACDELDLNWEAIAKPELPDPEQIPDDGVADFVQVVRQHCVEIIEREYSQIQLLNRRNISVHDLYVDVYVLNDLASETPIDPKKIPLVYDSQTDRFGLGDRRHQEPIDGVKIAVEKSRLVMLGKPGSGKSTFLKYLAEACRLGEFHSGYIPILILLGEADVQKLDLTELIQSKFNQDLVSLEQTRQILKQGQVLILIDGLDEVPQALQRALLNQIRDFSRKYSNNKYILTCRTQTVNYTLPNFDYVEVADFDEAKVTQFAKNWFAAFADLNSGIDLSEAFLQKLRSPDQDRTAKLAVTPVLLSLICWIYTSCQDLPARRSDLYKQGVELLLKEWDKQKGVERDSDHPVFNRLAATRKKDLLSYLALHKLEQSENFTIFEQDEILKLISDYLEIRLDDSEVVLQSIESHHGLLIERGTRYWTFSHLTFQEYFAARAILKSLDSKKLPFLSPDITDKRWREVIFLTLEMMPQGKVDELLLLMKHEIDSLLLKDEKLQEFLFWVEQKSHSVNTPYKSAAIRVFYFSFSISYITQSKIAAMIRCNFDFDFSLDLNLASVLEYILDPDSFSYGLILSKDYLFMLNSFSLISVLESTSPPFVVDTVRNPDSFIEGAIAQFKKNGLQALSDQLIEFQKIFDHRLIDEEKWQIEWHANHKVWAEKLRSIMIEHRNIQLDWQFNEEQKQLLQRYFSANKLLIDCLNLPDICVSQSVRAKIEATLMLPSSRIKDSEKSI